MTAKATDQDIPAQKLDDWLRVLMPVKKETTPIEILRSANSQTLCNPKNDLVISEEYKKLLSEKKCINKEISDLLPVNKQMLIDDFEDAVLALLTVENRMIYRQGLRDGFLLAIELFGGGVF